MPTINTIHYHSPCGELLLGSFEDKICLCDWTSAESRHRQVVSRLIQRYNATVHDRATEITAQAITQLEEYFQGHRTRFSLPLVLAGTPFQEEVWDALRLVPYGSTCSYSHLACSIGKPAAIRAVSRAVGANAISIFLPCHRIVGSDNSLTGYAGGLDAKQFLLQTEQRNVPS